MRGKGCNILVVGMGVSGRAVCELLLHRGMRVVATDMRDRSEFSGALDYLEEKGCTLRLGEHCIGDFLEADQVIVSPGVPLDLPPLAAARQKGIEVIGELEWAWRQLRVPVVAVTGTNGKTTTTSVIGEILKSSGKRVFVGGNIGTPLSRWLLTSEDVDVVVLEVSSFQLDTAVQFCPEIGVLLNITEDHLDRYEDFSAYAASKLSLFSRQRKSDTAIVNVDDPVCRSGISTLPGRILRFSRKSRETEAFLDGKHIVVSIPGEKSIEVNLEKTPLVGVHNEENILASVLACVVAGASPEAIQHTIDNYRGLPHRLEWIGAWRGIDFYDDSKATNVGAVVKAVENFDRPILILLGGRDKYGSYRPLVECLRPRGKGAFLYGEAAPRLQEELNGQIPAFRYPTLREAFEGAIEKANPGDVVLLSPACSSFDQYESYAQRGDHFKRLVRELCESQRD